MQQSDVLVTPKEDAMTARSRFHTEDERWEAVAKRDRQADGVFVYAVKTTGVYCRPVCSSRLPRRGNVEFFDTYDQAERYGFRPCKKCKPKSHSGNQIPVAVAQACNLIDAAEEPPSLGEIAAAVGLSPSYFHRLFKKTVGVTPKAYIATRRVERFREGLRGRVSTAIPPGAGQESGGVPQPSRVRERTFRRGRRYRRAE